MPGGSRRIDFGDGSYTTSTPWVGNQPRAAESVPTVQGGLAAESGHGSYYAAPRWHGRGAPPEYAATISVPPSAWRLRRPRRLPSSRAIPPSTKATSARSADYPPGPRRRLAGIPNGGRRMRAAMRERAGGLPAGLRRAGAADGPHVLRRQRRHLPHAARAVRLPSQPFGAARPGRSCSADFRRAHVDESTHPLEAPAYSYQYKNPQQMGAAPGTKYGPMAQDLEKTPRARASSAPTRAARSSSTPADSRSSPRARSASSGRSSTR